jgi:hypothetical protein
VRDPEEIDLDGLPGAATVETIDDRSGFLDLSDDSGVWETPARGVTGYFVAVFAATLLAAVVTAALLG